MSGSIHPVGDSERNHSGWDLFLLWAGAGIALPEIWAGGLIVKLGLVAGAVAVVLGHLIGNTVMASAGWIGARHGVPAIISTRAALGYRGAHLAAILNVVQMIGWTGFMVWVGGQAAGALPGFSDFGARGWMVVIGLVTTAWAFLGHRAWRVAQQVGVLLLLALAVLMTWRVLHAYPLAELNALPRDPGLPFGLALDFVVVMPISWLPLVADYTRYARSPTRGIIGTWLGYFVASSWMYLLGLCAALATKSDTPDVMVIQLLANTGWVGLALGLVLISTLTTTFLNIFSNAISAQALWPHVPTRLLVAIGGMLGTALAASVDGMLYEPFLLFIGSAFCPLFGIVLSDYFLVRRGVLDADALYRVDGFRYWKGVNAVALVVWVLGFFLYRLATTHGWPTGAALPALAFSAVLYSCLMRFVPAASPAPSQRRY